MQKFILREYIKQILKEEIEENDFLVFRDMLFQYLEEKGYVQDDEFMPDEISFVKYFGEDVRLVVFANFSNSDVSQHKNLEIYQFRISLQIAENQIIYPSLKDFRWHPDRTADLEVPDFETIEELFRAFQKNLDAMENRAEIEKEEKEEKKKFEY